MTKMKLDAIVVVDVECTAWDDPTLAHPMGGEIIEIGATLLDLKNGPQQKKSYLVRPQRTTVSEFCTKLTTLTQKDVDQGHTFVEACRLLKTEFRTEERTWASYGDFDRNQFKRECEEKYTQYPFGPRHINVKNLFAVMNRLTKEVGMPTALEKLGFSMDGTHHRGHDDAWNIAKILWKLLEQK